MSTGSDRRTGCAARRPVVFGRRIPIVHGIEGSRVDVAHVDALIKVRSAQDADPLSPAPRDRLLVPETSLLRVLTVLPRHRVVCALRAQPWAVALLLLLAACGGGGADAPVTPTPTPGTLALTLGTANASVVGSGTTTVAVTAARGGSFTGDVALAVDGLPSGVTASFAPAAIPAGSASSTLSLTVATSAAPGTYPLTVRGTGTGVAAASAGLTLVVVAPATPDFSVSVSPSPLSIQQGQQGTASVTITRTGGFTGTLGLLVSGTPLDVQFQVNPTAISGTTATLTFTVPVTVAAGTYPLTLTATENGPRSRSTVLTLVVTAQPTVGALTLSTTTVGARQTEPSAPVTITLARAPGITAPVQFSIDDLPAAVQATFSPNPMTGSTTTLVLTPSVNQGPGVITLRVRATVGTSSTTATITFTTQSFVPPDFTVALTSPVASVTAGNAVSVPVRVTRLSGFTGAVNFTVSGAPPGVSATLATASPSDSVVPLQITTTGAVTPGIYTVLVSGAAAGVSGVRTATLQLTVNAPSSGGSVQWRFCNPARLPLWFGVRSGTTGPWTVITMGASNTYTFPFPSAGQVAFVVQGSSAPHIEVRNLRPDEILAAAASECAVTPPPTTTLNGTITGIAVPRSGLVLFGGRGVFIDAPNTTWSLTSVPQRTGDLLAFRGYRGDGPFEGYERAILRRDFTPSGSPVPVFDLEGTEWISPSSLNSFWDGFGTDSFTVSTSLITRNGFVGTYQLSGPSRETPRGIVGLPPSAREASDLHQVLGATTNVTAPRQIITYARDIRLSGVRTFGPLLAVPTVQLLGSAPLRLRVQGAWQSEYDDQVTVQFVQNSSGRSITISATAAFLGASGYSLEMPDFTGASGWNPAWMLQSGTSTLILTTAAGLRSGDSFTPADGVEIHTAGRAVVTTP